MIKSIEEFHHLPPNIRSYLEKYSSSKWSALLPSDRKFKMIIVVPVIKEYDNIRILLNSFLKIKTSLKEDILCLFVVNSTPGSNENVNEDNRRTIDFLSAVINKNNPDNDKLIKQIIESDWNIGCIDAASEGLQMPEKAGGVGLARKIGMDLALLLFDYSKKGKNILVCLDADCTVSSNYTDKIFEIFNQINAHAAHVRFEHPFPMKKENKLAVICYEIFLRYYVLGLKYAGSPYAFHTIGSTMICDADAYVKIEGMNKRKAAEDFYFIEKLAKNYKVEEIGDACVFPSGRGSWRVPFGTGQRVNRFLARTQYEYTLYSPESFDILKQWIKLFHSREILTAEEYLEKAGKISVSLQNYLTINSFPDSWSKIIKNSKSDDQLHKQKKFWFDGFKTLKLIHFLRDNGYPNEDMFPALIEMLNRMQIKHPLQEFKEIVPPVDDQIRYLNILREIA